MTELAQLAEGLKMLDHLSGKTRKAEREATALSKQFLGLGQSLTDLGRDKRRGLDPLARDLGDLSVVAGRAATTLEKVFSSAFGKLMVKGRDFKSIVKELEGDLLKLGSQAFQRASGSSSSAGSNLLAGAVSSLAGLFPGFATGGAFTVGGVAGTDRNLVGMRLTRGERVTVQTPEQQRKNETQSVPSTINLSFNINTPNADSFRRSQGQIQGDALRSAQAQLRRNG